MSQPDSSEGRTHNKQVDIDAEDFSFTHDDSCEQLFDPRTLGKVSYHSGWDLANIFRYATVANAIVHIKRESSEQVVDILDVGSSAANLYTFWQCSYANPGRPRVNYLGLEVRDEPIEKANKQHAWNGKAVSRCEVIKHDVIEKPITSLDRKFDVIVLQEVLEHLPREVCTKLLADAYSILKPGGTVIVSTPNPKKHKGQYFVWEDSHVYEYALWEMLAEVKHAGFVTVDIKGWLGKARRMKKFFTEEQRAIYDELQSCSTGLATSIIAFMYPDLAECYTLVCKKPEDLPQKELDRVTAKYAKHHEPLPFAPEVKEEKDSSNE